MIVSALHHLGEAYLKDLPIVSQTYNIQISFPFLVMPHNDDGIPGWFLA